MNSLKTLRSELEHLPQDSPYLVIEKTAKRLEDMNFSPTLLSDIPDFLRLTNQQILDLFDQTSTMPLQESHSGIENPEEWKEKQLKLLIYWYRLLVDLRKDVPEAWDEVNELYEDD